MSLYLELLRSRETSYEPSPEVKRQMGEKTLIALIGPTAVGKSTVANEVIRLGGDDFSMAYSSVTRRRRPDDPADYQTADEGFTLERASQLINERSVTNYTVHPSGNIYATLPENFPAPYNLLPFLPSSLAAMRKAGFKAIHTTYIVTSTEAFSSQLANRANDPSFIARIKEGRESLEWGLAHTDELSFIENVHGNPSIAATRILSLLESPQPQREKDRGIALTREMLGHLNNLSL